MRPDFSKSAPRSINIALIAQLVSFCGLGGPKWLEGYIRGFPITGVVRQSGVFPLTLKPDIPEPLEISELLEGSIGRFKARSKRRPPHSQISWREALAQANSGWLGPPLLLDSSGRFADSPSTPIVNSCRSAVIQGEKYDRVTT